MAYLTDEQVTELRKLYKDGTHISFQYWAQKYGKTERQIWNVVHGYSYKHLEEAPAEHGRVRVEKPKKFTPEQRFWIRVDKKGLDDCWEWTGPCKAGSVKGKSFYGHLHFRGKVIGAHRLAWILTHGPIPKGLEVCHKCDNPGCCNPNHLWLGTHLENIRDRDSKGRGNARGMKKPSVVKSNYREALYSAPKMCTVPRKIVPREDKQKSIAETLELRRQGKRPCEIAKIQNISYAAVLNRLKKFQRIQEPC